MQFEASPGKKLVRSISANKPVLVVCACNPSYIEGQGIGKRITIQGWCGTKILLKQMKWQWERLDM
jgi:hypothetical protein